MFRVEGGGGRFSSVMNGEAGSRAYQKRKGGGAGLSAGNHFGERHELPVRAVKESRQKDRGI